MKMAEKEEMLSQVEQNAVEDLQNIFSSDGGMFDFQIFQIILIAVCSVFLFFAIVFSLFI